MSAATFAGHPSDKQAAMSRNSAPRTPMKRPAKPEEIAPAYVFLAAMFKLHHRRESADRRRLLSGVARLAVTHPSSDVADAAATG
ncbi:hypothetical protein X750_04190 [Mesorhizobium sp. LNJC394B00]|nr:hypothetical protein X750_04190 [Mesorhizobium sp. LNJC394B00]